MSVPMQHVRLYDVDKNMLRSKIHAGHPVLDCCFASAIQGFR